MKKKITIAVTVFSILLSFFSFAIPTSALVSGPQNNSSKSQAINSLNTLSGGKLKYHQNGGQIFLSGKLSNKEAPGKESSSEFLNKNKSIFGLNNPTGELKAISIDKNENGETFAKYSQMMNGLKVYGHTLTVHYDQNGIIRSVNGNLEENKTVTVLGNSSVSSTDAIKAAEKQFSYKSLRSTPTAEKMILNKDNKNYEVYKVNISYTEPDIKNYDVYVEANSGKVIQIESNLRYDTSVTGSGIDVQGNTVPLNLTLFGSEYLMKDTTKTGVTSGLFTYDMQHGYTGGNLVTNTSGYFSDENSKASVSAQYNAGKVIDFYKKLLGRNSLDNSCMEIDSFTHYESDYNNAFWDGYEMVYGDGDGTQFTYLSGDLGVVGHEMTHGVISNTADLDYNNQPGALNESIADTFGVLIKTYNKYNVAQGGTWAFHSEDWEVGEDIYTPQIAGDALRSLADPTLYHQPDNMSGYENIPDTETYDYGGVHENSGITNKAAYLIAQSIGMEKTAKIYYDAIVNYMGVYTNFAGAEDCLEEAATDLYPSTPSVKAAVINAFTAVGVDHITGIAMKSTPTKTTYVKGETLDLTGAAITISYGNGSTEEIPVTSDMISGYNADTLGQQTVTVTYGGQTAKFNVVVLQQISVSYQSYVQNAGWQNTVIDGTLCGTTGQSLRIEALKINLDNMPEGLHVEYRAHVQNVGWQNWVEDGTIAGTTGQNRRIEAIQIKLVGTNAQYYSVKYQAHVQGIGWQDWVNDSMTSGTTGQSLRIEALRIKIVKKIPSVTYQSHVQNIGWQNSVFNGDLSGTTGRSLRVEAVKINLANAPAGLRIECRAHVQNIGWQGWILDGGMAGTTGRSLRVEALEIKLVGTDADKYSVKYQAHVQNVGWQNWVSDGAMAGTAGRSLRIEAIRIKIIEK